MQNMTGRICWITGGKMPLRAATVVSVTTDGATIQLHEPAPLPTECDLFFTYSCTVGRRCFIESMSKDSVRLSFRARIGTLQVADNDDIVQVD
jgi:hypothetical protein